MVFFLLSLGVPALRADRTEKATGGIDLATANRIVVNYARHFLSQLPRDWRQAEEKKWQSNPPHIDAKGIYQLLGPAGQIAFEYDADKQQLLCWAVVHKPRREYPPIGLTREEILTALALAAETGIDTGGGDVVYDPVSDGFFLLRVYDQPPKNVRQLNGELDRLIDAGERWFRTHYLESVLAHAGTMRPPSSATARDGNFEVTLVLTPDVRYHELWQRSRAAQPQLVTRSEYTHGQEVWAMALFSGATAGDDGSAKFEAQYSFVYPDGEEAGSRPFVFWDAPPPPADHLQIVENRASIELGADMLSGDYLARIKVCNVVSQHCVLAETPFHLLSDQEP